MRLASGASWAYDRLVVSPGVDFMFDRVQGMTGGATTQCRTPGRPGAQTVLLRRQLEAMPDGGVVVISIPLAPYRCPPGPYERACQIAWYLKARKPRSRLVVLDANPQWCRKARCSRASGRRTTQALVEYRPNSMVARGRRQGSCSFILDSGRARPRRRAQPHSADARRAGSRGLAGLVTANDRWCDVDWTTLESVKVKHVHVLGDATLSAPGMPKSGHMANQHGKAAAVAIVDLLAGPRVRCRRR